MILELLCTAAYAESGDEQGSVHAVSPEATPPMTFCVWTAKMDGTNRAAYDALKELFPRFTGSQVDPAWLADELLAKNIIGRNIVHYASNQYHETDDRLRKVLFSVMGSGKRGVFEDLVNILLKKDEHSWLGQELLGEL